MPKPLLVMFFVVGALAGGGLAFARRDSDSEDRTSSSRSSATSTESSTPEVETPPDLDGASELERLLWSVRPDSFGPHDGMITGRVVDDQDTPVPGIEISAYSTSLPPGVDAKSVFETDVAAYVEQEAMRQIYRRYTERSAITSTDGSFALEGIGPNRYYLMAKSTTHRIERSNRWASAGDEVQFEAELGAPARLIVNHPNGEVVESISAQFGRSDESESWATVDPREVVLLPANTRWLELKADDAASPRMDVSLDPAKETEIQIDLVTRGMLLVDVLGPDGNRLESARLWYAPIAPGTAPPDVAEFPRQPNVTSTNTWQGRRAEIRHLEPGTYFVAAGWSWESANVGQVVRVDGKVELTLALDLTPNERQFQIRALDPSGAPVSGELDMMLSFRSPNSSMSTSVQPFELGDGNYLLEVSPQQWENFDSENATLTISCEHSSYGKASVELATGQHNATLAFVTPARLSVTVPNYADHPRKSMISLQLLRSNGQWEESVGSAKMSSDGICTFGAIQPGDYALTMQVRTSQQGWNSMTILRDELTLYEGDASHSLAIPDLHRVTLRFDPESWAGTSFNVTAGEESTGVGTFHSEVPPDGIVTLPCVAAGQYTVRSWGRGNMTQMTLEVFGDVDTEFREDVINALRVRITDPDGGLAKQGFNDGDLIVAIAGQEFENARSMQMALMGAIGREEMTVTVVRSGARVPHVFSPKSLMSNPMEMGGMLTPASR